VNSPFHDIYKVGSIEDEEDKPSARFLEQAWQEKVRQLRQTTDPSTRFLEQAWGEKARQLRQTTIRLGPQNWAMIKKHAEAHFQIQHKSTEQREDKGKGVTYPHAYLIVDWYVSVASLKAYE
jgi:hypothetical protein